MTERGLTHDSFVLEREYPVPPATVFRAFADPEVKRRWFGADEAFDTESESMDFREGGTEHNEGRWHDGPRSRLDVRYHEIAEDERIVYSYEMYIDCIRLSVSLTSIELIPIGGGTRLKLTEHGAYFDNHDNPAQRRQGTGGLLDALGRELESAR